MAVRNEPTRRASTASSNPLDPARAAVDLETASDREPLFSALLRAGFSRVPFVGLLSVHKDALRGRRALTAGAGADASSVGSLVIPRDAVRVLEDAVIARAPMVGSAAVGDAAACDVWRRLGGG